MTGGHIRLIPAMREMHKADLITLPGGLWEANQAISSEIDIVTTETENLNSPELINPSVYDGLVIITLLHGCRDRKRRKHWKREKSG